MSSFLVGLIALIGSSAGTSFSGFSWSAPEGCPTEAWVLHRTESLLGRKLADDANIVVIVRASQRSFRAEIRLEDVHTRTLEAQRCQTLGETVAVVVALALQDPERIAPVFTERNTPSSKQEATPEPRRMPIAKPVPDEPGSTGSLRVGFYAGSLAVSNWVPGWTWGVSGGVEVEDAAWVLGAGFAWFAPQETSQNEVEVQLWAVEGAGTWWLVSAPVRLGPRFRVRGGQFRALGRAVEAPRNESSWFWSAEALAALRWQFASLVSADVAVGVQVPITRPRVRLRGGSELFRPSFGPLGTFTLQFALP